MKKVSITQAKNNLSVLLDAVRHGDTVVITDRNRTIARIDSVLEYETNENSGRIARLERQGILLRPRTPLDQSLLSTKPPVPADNSSAVTHLLNEREVGQ
jgi:prevent-host-death family protein